VMTISTREEAIALLGSTSVIDSPTVLTLNPDL